MHMDMVSLAWAALAIVKRANIFNKMLSYQEKNNLMREKVLKFHYHLSRHLRLSIF